MAEKTILLIQSGRFLGEVIGSLFDDNDALTVIEAAPSTARDLVEAVDTHRPNCVILDDTVQHRYLTALLRHMQGSRDMRVVVVNTNSNCLEVYGKQQIEVHRKADFFAAL